MRFQIRDPIKDARVAHTHTHTHMANPSFMRNYRISYTRLSVRANENRDYSGTSRSVSHIRAD
jgi:hypothetical protein